jgi:prolyl-tRNA editing enzyme YbaK/EbsC (Cys-tRNA(Pro) deacylase)
MSEILKSSARKVQAALEEAGFSCRVVELPGSTRTSPEAAEAVGCRVEQIAKALVFKGRQSGRPVLVIASGANRVAEQKVGALVGEPVKMARAEYVREHTGYAIGGIPPLGHATPMTTLIDEDLLLNDPIWAAAGTPHSMFALTPNDLKRMTSGRVCNVKL